jgi:mycothiol synthase
MEIRPYRGTDEAQLLEVWNTAMHADCISEALFRSKVLLDANFLPENLPVAVQDGHVVGFVLCVTRQVPLFLQGLEPDKAWITAFGVHPAYRGQGIGTALFKSVHDRLASQKRRTIDISPYVPNYFAPGIDINTYAHTIPFLQKAGYSMVDYAMSMGADLTNFQIPEVLVELERKREQEDGVTIRPLSSADVPELMPFIIQHFGWDWFRHTQEYLLDLFGPSPQQVCILVARKNGEIVGYCQQKNERFGPFGVDPAYRNLGIGRLLLFHCLAAMRSRHIFYAYFMWTNEEASRLYSTAGFKRRREFSLMQKML